MKKILLLSFLLVLISTMGFSQSDKFWSANSNALSSIVTDKSVARQSFPKEFKLFNLNIEPLRQELFSIVDKSAKRKTVITLPNAEGNFEQFEVNEASNFEPDLQARFPEIRAFSGKGITDKASTLKLSISPQGIQTMIFRTGKQNEFIEAYSKDHSVYAVFTSQRQKGQLPWACSTEDKQMFDGQKSQLPTTNLTGSSAGELKTVRLAQSCNGEYANFFGATSAAQVALVLAAFNATLTRCNGVYEKDLALHLNLVPETVNVIYYNPATDPYSALGNWNTELQIALNTTLTGPATPIAANNAAYDIGHMFGASGGGGNAGCIGCVCVDGVASGTGATKGRGITSPADNIPMGDNFDIDYVAHEVGHQLGGNHTFSMSTEGTGVNKEVGSGITIMGYAGITAQDVAPHSIDIFHETSIAQIQANLATKTCPITTNINATNATPVVSPQGPYTIPISTPFALTGVATDANAGDVLTYCWEQNDDGTGQTGNNSVARENKPTGPNWLTFPATTSSTRLFPKLSTILAGLYITPVLPGGDAIANIEALSNVSRTLNYRLTVRDNSPYVPVSPGPAKVAQTAFTDVVVTVSNTSGPFAVTSPNTNVSWAGGSTQNITWDVNNTTAAPVSCANVKISLSIDGGNTFPTVLVASTPNDGTQALTIPNTPSTTARVKVESVGNIFFDISNSNFTITPGGPATNPTVTINQAAAQPDPTTVSPINFTVVFDQAVTGFTTGDVTLAGTAGATTATVTGGPTTYNVAVTGMTAPGTVIATIAAGVCQNALNELNLASTSTDNTVTFNIVASPPNVTINQAASQPDPTSVSPINFTVVFDQPVIGFATGDVTLAGTAGATTATVTGSGATYNVAVTGMTLDGTVIATIAAGVCTNTSAQPNNASTSTDNTVTFSTTCVPPTVNPVANQAVCAGAPTAAINFTGTPTASFSWTNNNTAIGLAASGSGNIASFIATNTTAAPIVATITVTPSLPGGGGNVPVTFSNSGNIEVPAVPTTTGTASPYPSPIVVSGLPTTGVNIESIRLNNITHTWAADIEVLLVGPGGQHFVPMSDVGGSLGFDVTSTVTIKDGSPAMPTTTTAIPTGTYGPTSFGTLNGFVAPAPGAPYNRAAPSGTSTFANVFNGTNVNGTWNLYVNDGASGDVGNIAGGWDITFLAPSSTCTGAPTTFTITVNPNPALIIVADPGTTLCEGDPTLLTVYNSAGFANIALTQSSSQVPIAGSVSCNAGGLHTDNSYWRAYNLAPLGLPSALTVNTVTFGVEQAAGGAQPVTVNIYSQNAGPAFPGGTRTLLGSQAASVPNQALTLFTVNFATPVVVPSNAVMIVELFTPSGQATGRSFFIGSNPAAQTGTSYLSAAACGVATPTDVAAIGFPNMHIILNVGGTVGSTGAIATGTFLWSPAAGLSSTTSNPVAASPMNTTTYTVVRTNAGCSSTANITITVNKRPTVTVQPVASVNCATTAATFTVTGTGTNLTYRWQESTTGTTGPWTNLADGGIYSGTGTASLVINPVSGLMNGYAYRCILSGICAPIGTNNISNPALLTVNPLPVVAITPSVTCGGVAGTNGVALSVGSIPPPVPGSCTTSSGAISIAVPDNTANGVQATLAVSCVPANATVTGIRVNLNMPGHTFVGDMIFNLKAPNGAILNLDKYMSATATQAGAYPNSGFVNATISSSGTAALGGATTTPITGTWKADLINGTVPFVVQDPAGFVSTATAWSQLFSVPNGTWTLAMADGGPGDVGTLTSWSVTVEYTTPGTTGSTNTYVWSPLAGLYNDPLATSPYTGTNAIVVYAAPTVFTVYTVTATNTATGCVNTAQAFVNYTPPPPSVTPNPVAMCLGDGPVRLISSSSTTTVVSAASGPISIVVPDGTGAPAISNLSIASVPAASTIGEVKVTMNMSHTWVGDMDVNLKAPNGAILNLVGGLDGGTGSNGTANFTNTAFSSLGGATISGAAAPRTGTYAAEARVGYGPAGYIQTGPATWANLTPTPTAANGTWTLAMGDFGGGDVGTLTSWSISVSYIVGVQSTPATWAPTAGLFNDALASSPYTGTPRDTVWTQPTPSGVYNYDVTVQSIPAPPLAYTNPAPITINASGAATPYPSNITVSGLPTTGATVKSVVLTGMNHTWASDVDVVLQSPTGTNVILMSDVGGNVAIPAGAVYTFADSGPAMAAAPNPTGTYHPTNLVGTLGVEPDNWPAPGPGNVTQPNPALSLFTGNMNGVWKLYIVDDAAGDGGSVTGGYTINFDIGITACTSPARRVVVTVNTPTSVATQPVNATVCTDKVATFSVVAAGTGPFSYRWEVSTNGGNPPWTTVNNGGVYSGATTATLTITAPPVTMTGYQYRVIITGAAPCAAVTSFTRILTVNPLPTIVIKADPYTSLFPGLVTTLSSTVTPAAANSYTWLLNGTAVPNAITGTLNVNVDGLGDYQLRVTDINGCTNISNTVTIKDSVTGKCYIYPNPTSGVFQVRYYSAANNVQLPRTLTVYDAKGDRVLTQRYAIGRPYDRMDVDMRAYGKGLYWVEIGDRNGNRLTMCRVVIQ